MAIVGGAYAINNLFFKTNTVGPEINKEGAAGFASTYISSYFTYTKDSGFEPILEFTNQKDNRRAPDNILWQQVIAAQPIEVIHLKDSYLKAKVLFTLKTKKQFGDENYRREEVARETFVATLFLQEGLNGFEVVHYPAVDPYGKVDKLDPPYPKKAQDGVGENIKPMLISFFKTYFSAEDVANFLAAGAEKPIVTKQAFDYVNIESLEVYGEGMPWLTYATVTVQDKASGIQFSMTYEISVTYENQKFAIQSFNL